MPHVAVKLYAGKSEQQKARIAEEITNAVMNSALCERASVSVTIEDVAPSDWAEKVYKPNILNQWDHVYEKPGYNPL